MTFWRILDLVPWAALASQAVNVAVALIVWQLTKHYYHMEWLRYAPDKAKDTIQGLQAALATSEIERQALEHENAKLRGKEARAQAILTAKS